MINALFRTQFESHINTFIVFLALNALMGLLLLNIHIENGYQPVRTDAYHFIVLWLLIFCLAAATLGLIRHNREKRGRLYAQLPVTPREIRLSYWCLAALYIFISTGMFTLFVLLGGLMPLLSVFGFALLYFFHAGTLLAVLSIFTSNDLPLIPEEIRRRTIPYFFLAAMLTFLFLFAMGLVVTGYIHLVGDGEVKWWMLTFIMMAVFAALVTLDVGLFQKKDNYLG